MTCTNAAPADGRDASDGHDGGDGPTRAAKAVLHCPRCGYRAPWDGAWHVRTAAGYREVHCPECGARVA